MQIRMMPVLQTLVLRHATVQLAMKEFRVKVSEATLCREHKNDRICLTLRLRKLLPQTCEKFLSYHFSNIHISAINAVLLTVFNQVGCSRMFNIPAENPPLLTQLPLPDGIFAVFLKAILSKNEHALYICWVPCSLRHVFPFLKLVSLVSEQLCGK